MEEISMEKKIYWTFEAYGERFDHEELTREAAQAKADSWWEEQVLGSESPRNGDEFCEDIIIIEFYIDDDGDQVDVNRYPGVAHYEHYHGDRAEHGTW